MNLAAIKKEFRPSNIFASLTAGLIATIVSISLQISLAALIFSGDLSQFLGSGIGLMLFGAFVMGIIITLTTSHPGMIGVPQSTPAAILGLLAAAIALSMKGSPPQVIYATVLAATILTSLLTAIFFLLLGTFKASTFIRYIPYPVVGGFLAGTGFLLSKGALGLVINFPLTPGNLPKLFGYNALINWLPAVIFAVGLLLVLRRSNHFFITPGALLLATALFYGYLIVAHIPLAEAAARGWFLGSFPSHGLYQLPQISLLSQVDWRLILFQPDKIGTIIILSVVSLLLNASALEVITKQDIDLNRELLSAGWANLAGGLGGSPVGFQALSLSSLAYHLGVRSRLVGLFTALFCGAILFFGSSLISFFPRPILGGMLLFLGLSFMVEWLVDARKHLPLVDYLLLWIILVIIATIGFLQGIIAGIFIATIIFVISYSRINAINHTLSGEIYRSNVDRPKVHRETLSHRGAQIHILRLQGFIFFGTVQTILEKINIRLREKHKQPLKYIILDFQRVSRLDSSAVFGIMRLKQFTQENKLKMVWTHVSDTIRNQLERGGIVDEPDESFIMLPTLDHGAEWCENKILAEQGVKDLTGAVMHMETQLKHAFPELESVDRLMKYLEHKEIKEGDYLMHQGDEANEMYFVESGLVTAQLETPDGEVLRLRSIRPGATVGEVGLYLKTIRTASVVAARPSSVYRLSARALKDMHEHDPDVAAHMHEWVARLLAERLTENDRIIGALLD
jgi:sulfate permease, SulP family